MGRADRAGQLSVSCRFSLQVPVLAFDLFLQKAPSPQLPGSSSLPPSIFHPTARASNPFTSSQPTWQYPSAQFFLHLILRLSFLAPYRAPSSASSTIDHRTVLSLAPILRGSAILTPSSTPSFLSASNWRPHIITWFFLANFLGIGDNYYPPTRGHKQLRASTRPRSEP